MIIVVPCYNEQEVLPLSHPRLQALCQQIVAEGLCPTAELLYVDDGSRDTTWQLIQEYSHTPGVHGLRLAHNVGHQNALWAGMEHAAHRLQADAIVSIDADLQDDLATILAMVRGWREGADVVYGVRRERTTDTRFKRWTALAFYRLMNALGCESVYNHADFRLLSRRALLALLAYPERNLFIRGLVPLVGFNVRYEYYDRTERLAGESKYPLGRMLALALDGITSFSVRPLRWILGFGIFFVLVSLAVTIYALVAHLSGNTVPGWTSLLISLWFIGGILLLALGVVGEYIGKIYKEVKQRPRYHVMEESSAG